MSEVECEGKFPNAGLLEVPLMIKSMLEEEFAVVGQKYSSQLCWTCSGPTKVQQPEETSSSPPNSPKGVPYPQNDSPLLLSDKSSSIIKVSLSPSAASLATLEMA